MLKLLWDWTEPRRFTIILAALLTLFLAGTLIETQNPRVFSPFRITSTIVVLSSVLASTDNRRHLIAFGVLVLGWVIATWSPLAGTILIEDAFLVVILFFVVGLMTARLVRREKVTFDDISGAIAIYLCLALAWAVSYRLLDGLHPEAFTVNFQDDFNAAVYFSLTTITTLGYGDISPVMPFARLWATIEAAVGLLYVAILVSKLVSEFQR